MISEWVENYRDLLNSWRFWARRANFDVARADLLRERIRRGKIAEKQKQRNNGGNGGNGGGSNNDWSNTTTTTSNNNNNNNNNTNTNSINDNDSKNDLNSKKEIDANPINVPSALQARCNFCNMNLPLAFLRRQEGMSSAFLSRQKPLLSCCPACRKPLPRCYVCLLGMECQNPYTELKRQRQIEVRRPRGHVAAGGFSELGNDIGMNAMWSWCVNCKHSGHSKHLADWFENHDTCGVSGCDCTCSIK